MPRKRKYYYVNDDSPRSRRSGISDFAGSAVEMLIAVFALAILAVLCTIAMVVLIIVTYWYIVLPAVIIAIYLWHRFKQPVVPSSDPAHIVTTTEEIIKTPTGTKKIVTTETHDPAIQKSGHPLWSMLTGLFH